MLGESVAEVSSRTAVVTQRFTSAEAFADLFLEAYGPTHMVYQRLPEEGRTALRADLVAHARAANRSGGTDVVCDWEYRIVTAARAASTHGTHQG
jgi:hypothetical protein